MEKTIDREVNRRKDSSMNKFNNLVIPILQNECELFKNGYFENVEGVRTNRNEIYDKQLCIDYIFHNHKRRNIYLASRCEYKSNLDETSMFCIRTKREYIDSGRPSHDTEYIKILRNLKKGFLIPTYSIQSNLVFGNYMEIGIVNTEKLIEFMEKNLSSFKEIIKEDTNVISGTRARFSLVPWDLLTKNNIDVLTYRVDVPYTIKK